MDTANVRDLFRRWLLLFLGLSLCGTVLLGQNESSRRGTPSLKKRTGFADEGVGVQTKGQLQNLIMNYGQITDTRYEDVGNAPTELFFDFRYPRENFTGLCDDFAFFVAMQENSKNGNQGNVIDGWTDNDNEDWIAKDGSYGKTHYNPALDPNPHPELLYNNQTPYLAHSDLPDTWPVDATGVSFWPGLFRRHPLSGVEIPGEFASDRDIYFEFTDGNNQQGDVVGLEVHGMAYSYGRVYAEDILFYELLLINKSGRTLTGVYAGMYQDPDCSDHTEETLLVVDSTYADGTKLFSIADRDFDGDIGGATRPNARGIAEDYTFGTIFLETPYNMGITDFHYLLDPGPTDDFRLWPIISSDPTNPRIAGEVSNYFHGTNPRKDDVSLITKLDWAWTAATGPFDMAPGDTVKMTFAVAAGDDDADYYSNVWQAKQLFDAHFNGPAAPPAPRLSAVAGDRRVTLYWDDTPEVALDPSTGEQDFEGYKIYRSEDGGITWGKKITDALGRTIGYVPVAQFDLDDNIKGVDPKNSAMYLGDDSGLRHSWVDSLVTNGIQYSYTIVSYDKGTPTLFALEGSRGDGPQVKNFVNVIPVPVPLGTSAAALKSLTHVAGLGEGTVSIDIIDANALKLFPYRILMEGTPASTFSVERIEGTSDVPVLLFKHVNTPDLAVFDGLRVRVDTDALIGGLKSVTDGNGKNVSGIGNISADSSWYVTAGVFPFADTSSKSRSYEIRFSDETSIAYSWGSVGSVASHAVPFSVWDVTSNTKVSFEADDPNGNKIWEEGERILISRVPYPASDPTIGTPNPVTSNAAFAYQVIIFNAPGAATGIPPVSGTTIRINSLNALRAGDMFEFEVAGRTFDASRVDLSEVRVVPNPYVVSSKFELRQNVREIRFMFLPPECTITVYTVAGVKVRTLHHNGPSGSLSWNLVTDWDQALSYGVYVYVLEDPNGNRHMGKFALIK